MWALTSLYRLAPRGDGLQGREVFGRGGADGARLQVSADKPEMGTLFAIDTPNTVVLSIVSALNVPVPAHREGEGELWIAELGLVGELVKRANGSATFNRGV